MFGGAQYGDVAMTERANFNSISTEKQVVLVVDDTPSKRYVLASWLRRGGYTVREASTGTDALDIFRAGGIDLVVLDVRLPDMTGFEVCEQIKGDPTYGTTPVIHVSAAAIHSVDRTHGLERGADAYLTEPIDPDELLATVAAISRYYQARLQAERLAERLEQLARVSLAMTISTTLLQVLQEAAAGAAQIFRAPVAIMAADRTGARIVATCAGPGSEPVLRPSGGPSGGASQDAPIGVRISDQPTRNWPQQDWPTDEVLRVLTIRPRADRGAVYVAVPAAAAMAAAPVLTLFGQTLVSTIDVIRSYDEEHDLALTLQRSLLPRELPFVPELELTVRYVPASDRAEIGGDFYEVARFGKQVVIAVGDVGGHSLHAATIMAELRHATRAYLAEGHGPAAVIDRLNTMMQTLIPGEIATICIISIDVTTGAGILANAGHPPPVLVTPAATRLITEHTPLLGIPVRSARDVDFDLEPGATIVLYTDGLIETRTDDLDRGLARLIDAVSSMEPDLEAFASRLLADVGPSDPADDIAMVVVRRPT